jgi:hypothetical protein
LLPPDFADALRCGEKVQIPRLARGDKTVFRRRRRGFDAISFALAMTKLFLGVFDPGVDTLTSWAVFL